MTINRAPIVLGATALGLGATLGFSAHHAESATTAATATAAAAPATPTSTSGSASTSPSTSAPASSSSSATRTVTSDAVGTQYGNVQLKVTIADGKITKIEAVELPSNDPKSQQIGSYAEPLLQQSALTKQNGTVDGVSGATYTSNGYQTALQSALDKAGFKPSSTTNPAA
jgi:uncharacterized protein with FMN-binding domain